jgi:hypothetical protein
MILLCVGEVKCRRRREEVRGTFDQEFAVPSASASGKFSEQPMPKS